MPDEIRLAELLAAQHETMRDMMGVSTWKPPSRITRFLDRLAKHFALPSRRGPGWGE